MATSPFLQLDVMKKAFQKGKQIYDCYRLMYRKELWVKTHKRLFQTEPSQSEMGEIELLITQLRKGNFRFSIDNCPVYPSVSYRETMVVQVITDILSFIFLDSRYYLPKCTSAAKKLKREWDVKDVFIIGEFIFLPIQPFLKILETRINDYRFLILLTSALQIGRMSMEAVKPFILSIYLQEWIVYLKRNMDFEKTENTRFKRIEYCWSTKQFVIGVRGSKQDIIGVIKKGYPYSVNLYDSTVVSTLKKPILLFGYLIRKCDRSNKILLDIPHDSLSKISRRYGNIQCFKPAPRAHLLNYSESDILRVYHSELIRAVRNFGGVNKSGNLNRLFSLARGSFIKTIAMKRKCSVRKTCMEMRSYKQGYLCIKEKGKISPFLTLKQLSFLRF